MTEVVSIQLDDNVLERLGALICGDDDDLLYRRGFEIVKFFRMAGWSVPNDLDGASRRAWTVDQLLAHRDDGPALGRLLLRLADPREYLAEKQAHERVVDELNELIAVDGLAVVDITSRPRLIERKSNNSRLAQDEPAELTVDVTDIVSDVEFARQLRRRLDEAHTCLTSGAPTAAVIMLGSVLEGVLYDVALKRSTAGKRPSDHLASLIDTAHTNRWITTDIVEYAHVVRGHRNLVHPKRQLDDFYSPTDKTALIAWNVVVAALTDLAASAALHSGR
jgi:hypothetical protein